MKRLGSGKKDVSLHSFVAFVALLFTVIYFLTPLYGDDLWFLVGTNLSGSRWETFMIALEGTSRRWQTETGRFANIISSPFIGLLPKWLLDILCGFTVWLMLRLSLRLAGIIRSNTTGWVLVASLVLFLPWYDSMFSRMFTINYVWTAVVDLLFIMLMFKSFGNFKPKVAGMSALCLFSVLAGWMHEGFSVPVICALGVIMVWRKKRNLPVSASSILCYALFCAGAFLITLSPMFRQRAGGEGTTFADMPAWEILVMVGPLAVLFAILLAVVVINRKRIFADSGKVQMLLLSVTVSAMSLLITGFFFGGPRAGFFAELINFIALAKFIQSDSKDSTLIVPAFALRVVSVLAVSFNLLWAIDSQAELKKETDIITRLFAESQDGTVYYDNLPMRPDPAMLKTSAGQFNLKNLITDFSYYHRPSKSDPDSQKLLQLLPSTLAGFQGNAVAGDVSSLQNPLIFKGNIVVSKKGFEDAAPESIIITTTGGIELESRFRAVPFSASDSTQWMLIKPHAAVYRTLSISRVRFPER